MSGWYRASKETVNQYRSIDARLMSQEGCFKPGTRFGWVWKQNGEIIANIGCATSHTGKTLIVMYNQRGNTYENKIRLTFKRPNYGGQIAWFICPSCGKRVRKLYAKGYMACRICYRFTYSICKENPDQMDLIDRKIRRIHKNLKAPNTNIFDLPPRPKGMHYTTYHKYLEELTGLLEARHRAFINGAKIAFPELAQALKGG
jgi:hypothetical protein